MTERKQTPDLLGELLGGGASGPTPVVAAPRPRYRNGEKIANWEDQPLLHDYLNQLGAEGWELAGASAGRALYGSRDEYQLFCKRASSAA